MKSEIKKQSFLTTHYANFIVLSIILTMTVFCAPVFADALTDAQTLLSKGTEIAGIFLAAWGVVLIGINFKEHNGPSITGGILQLIGGIIIYAASKIISSADISMGLSTADASMDLAAQAFQWI